MTASTRERHSIAENGSSLRRFNPYPAYKDSGVEWLGEIPAHWAVKRLKAIASVRLSNVDKKTVEGEVPVRLCNYTDVYYNEHITPELDFMVATASTDQVSRFRLQRGDVLVTKDSESWDDIAVPGVVVSDLDNVLCGYHLALIRPSNGVQGPFLARALGAPGPREQFRVAANGITRYGLTAEAITGASIGLPSDAEQRAIAAFLDRETAKIDALVAKKERLIKLLQEKRTALIAQTVTSGLDSTVALKDSGVDWLGEIPAHWEVVRLGREIALQRGEDITKDTQRDGSIPVVSSGGVSSFHDTAIASGPGVVVGRKGSAGAVYYVESDFWPHDTTLWVKEFRGNCPRYVFYKLLSMELASFDTGSANPTLNRNLIHPITVCWPSPDEQAQIATFLDRETGKIDSLIDKVRDAIERLKELRTTLISAAITGKIDVREEVV